MIYKADKENYSQLIQIWVSSVLATHHFLQKEDFEFYKSNLPLYFDHLDLFVYKKDIHSEPEGFLGVSSDNIEMLFIHNESRAKGIGKELLFYAVKELGIRQVDVNEQNTQAVEFYIHLGFTIYSRAETDSEGKNYPILHLRYG